MDHTKKATAEGKSKLTAEEADNEDEGGLPPEGTCRTLEPGKGILTY